MLRRLLLFGFLLLVAAPHARSHAQTKTDATVEKRVEQKLDQTGLTQVEASVQNGVVTLTGEVAKSPQKQLASEAALSVKDVQRVNNQVTLDPDPRLRVADALRQAKIKLIRLGLKLPQLLIAIAIVLISIIVGGFIARHIRLVKRFSDANPYLEGLLRTIIKGAALLAGTLIALDLLGATSLVGAVLGSAGLIGLVLGFAFKDIAENYVAGVLLSLRRPFAPGDAVKVDVHEGKVVALTSRATILMTVDGNHLQLPNSVVFKGVLLNYTRNPMRRFSFSTNVSNAGSWHEAMETGIATMRELEGVLADPAPSAVIDDVSDSAAKLTFAGWINQERNDLGKTRSEAIRMVRRALRKKGLTPDGSSQAALAGPASDGAIDHVASATPPAAVPTSPIGGTASAGVAIGDLAGSVSDAAHHMGAKPVGTKPSSSAAHGAAAASSAPSAAHVATPAASTPIAIEPAAQRDTSVDTTLDEQVHSARQQQPGTDMLAAPVVTTGKQKTLTPS